jgi:hypothetical protein
MMVPELSNNTKSRLLTNVLLENRMVGNLKTMHEVEEMFTKLLDTDKDGVIANCMLRFINIDEDHQDTLYCEADSAISDSRLIDEEDDELRADLLTHLNESIDTLTNTLEAIIYGNAP